MRALWFKRENERTPAPKRVGQAFFLCGATGNRTPDLLLAKQALYQLSYGPGMTVKPVVIVGIPGLEPGTSSLSAKRSNRLSYIPDSAD
jgi:hypothetical protein